MEENLETLFEQLKEAVEKNNKLYEEAEKRRIEKRKEEMRREITRLEEEILQASINKLIPIPNYVCFPICCPCMKDYFKKEN